MKFRVWVIWPNVDAYFSMHNHALSSIDSADSLSIDYEDTLGQPAQMQDTHIADICS